MIPLSLEPIYGVNTTVSAHSDAKMRALTYALRQNCSSMGDSFRFVYNMGHVWALQTILI